MYSSTNRQTVTVPEEVMSKHGGDSVNLPTSESGTAGLVGGPWGDLVAKEWKSI